MYTLEQLKNDRTLWQNIQFIPAKCSWCNSEFEIKYGTLYNAIRRGAKGIFCQTKCGGSYRANLTQERYRKDGGKTCKRCGEFKKLIEFSPLPNPPFFRAECKRCHNYKPARKYTVCKDRALRKSINFKISLDEFLKVGQQPCIYCNEYAKNIRLELLDFSLGYISENIVSCCRICQKFKNGMSHEDFIKLCCKISSNVKV